MFFLTRLTPHRVDDRKAHTYYGGGQFDCVVCQCCRSGAGAGLWSFRAAAACIVSLLGLV